MMLKDDAIVLSEAREIMATLPVESRGDVELAKAIIGSLQTGQDRHDVEIKAQAIAHQRLEAKVDQGFILVNHELEKQTIHRGYLEKNLTQLQSTLERTVDFTQKLATQVVHAEAKADSAKDLAKNSRWANFDPLTGMVICAIGLIALMALGSLVKIEKVKEVEPQSQQQQARCGIEVRCDVIPIDKPRAK
jgi:hypothetical protein